MSLSHSFSLIITVIALAMLTLSCNRSITASVADYENFQTENPEEIASFRKTGCFGMCPIYRVHFYEDGQAVYRGQMNVEMDGTHFGKFNKKELRRLIRKAERNGFFFMADVYPVEELEFLPDLSNTITTIQKGDMVKTVTHNHSGPDELKKIEDMFLELIESIIWLSIDKDK